nr:calcium-dependent protein kinase 1-like [Onthophagus taurus]
MNRPRVIGDWKIISQLGEGGFGVVTLWRNTETNDYFALKQCKMQMPNSVSPRQKERWKQEVAAMQKLKCDYIVGFKELPDMLLMELNKYNPSKLPLLPMEYCSKGNLRNYLREWESRRGLSETTTRTILSDICDGISYLHSCGITHRDIKPENIVMQHSDERLEKIIYKIIDLGYAKELGNTLNSLVGTLPYLAPEIFQQDKYTKTVDYWSFGLTCYEIITGELPFLPRWEPVRRFIHIKEKKEDDICIFTIKDKVVFSKEIPRKLWISTCFKKNIENWLRPVLQFDGNKRGSYKNITINVLSQMKEILLKKIVKILFVYDLTIYSYEITEFSTFRDLKELVTSKGFLHNQLVILCDNQTDFYNDDDKIMESIENIDHTTEFYIFNRNDYIDNEKRKSFPKVLEKLYTHRTDFNSNETLEMCFELLYFLKEEELMIDFLNRAIKTQIMFTDYTLDSFLSKKLFYKIRTDLTALTIKIECYDLMNNDLLNNNNCGNKSQFLNTYRKLLRQIKELIENFNGMSEQFLQFNNNKEPLETMIKKIKDEMKEDEFKTFCYSSITACKRILRTPNPNDVSQSESNHPPAYKELYNILNNLLKKFRNYVVNEEMKKFVSYSIKIARKLKRHYTWCMALDKEIFRISQELMENQKLINQKLVLNDNNNTLGSIVLRNMSFSDPSETKNLVHENMELRYAIQERINETELCLQNIQRETLKLFNGLSSRYSDI